IARASAGMSCGRWLRENNSTLDPFLKASRRMPSNFLSKLHSGPVKRSCVSVAAMGSIQSGKDFGMGSTHPLTQAVVTSSRNTRTAPSCQPSPTGAEENRHLVLSLIQITCRQRDLFLVRFARDLNVLEEMWQFFEQERRRPIYLGAIGFGM